MLGWRSTPVINECPVPSTLKYPGWEYIVRGFMPAHVLAAVTETQFLYDAEKCFQPIYKAMLQALYENSPHRGGRL